MRFHTHSVISATSLLLSFTTAQTWQVFLDWETNCSGDGYEDQGAGPVNCRNIYLYATFFFFSFLRHKSPKLHLRIKQLLGTGYMLIGYAIYRRNGVGAVSVQFQTQVETCTIIAYEGQYCQGNAEEATVPSGYGACLQNFQTQSYLVTC